MSIQEINILGFKYKIACDDGQEQRLKDLATALERKIRSVTDNSGYLSDSQSLVLTALTLVDELDDANTRAIMLSQKLERLERTAGQDRAEIERQAIQNAEEAVARKLEAIAEEVEKL